jgi:hypothetical protein
MFGAQGFTVAVPPRKGPAARSELVPAVPALLKPSGPRLMNVPQQRPHSYNNQPYLPNGAAAGHSGPHPGAAPLLPNNGRIIQTGGVRVLCIADVRGEE